MRLKSCVGLVCKINKVKQLQNNFKINDYALKRREFKVARLDFLGAIPLKFEH